MKDTHIETYKIHPYKFLIWLSVGGVVMIFAALTSAYIVKKSHQEWYNIALPFWFYMSTIAMLLSSFFIWMARTSFHKKAYSSFYAFLWSSFVLGMLFIVFQILGFKELASKGLFLAGNNVASSFLYVIVGAHGLHVIGGLIAFAFVISRYYSPRRLEYTTLRLDVFSIYWHFVDLLWIYLLVFFYIQSAY